MCSWLRFLTTSSIESCAYHIPLKGRGFNRVHINPNYFQYCCSQNIRKGSLRDSIEQQLYPSSLNFSLAELTGTMSTVRPAGSSHNRGEMHTPAHGQGMGGGFVTFCKTTLTRDTVVSYVTYTINETTEMQFTARCPQRTTNIFKL